MTIDIENPPVEKQEALAIALRSSSRLHDLPVSDSVANVVAIDGVNDLVLASPTAMQALVGSSFVDTLFRIFDNSDPTKQLAFEIASIATATTRTVTWPNSGGVVILDGATQTLTNKTFLDSSVTFADNGDATKKLAFQCAAITTATTRTLTMADQDIDLAAMPPAIAYRRGNVLGAVSQSGGTPTGAWAQRGTGAQGEYVMYADGRMECTYTDATGLSASVVDGNNFTHATGATWTFPTPVPFAVAPVVTGSSASLTRWVTTGAVTTTTAAYNNYRSTTTGTAAGISLTAVGRWF